MKWNDPDRSSRMEMEEAARKGQHAEKPKMPWRDRLYGGLKGKVSVKAMNIIIYLIVFLILAAVIIGAVTGQN